MKQIELPKFKDYTDQKVRFFQRKLDGHLVKIHKNSDYEVLHGHIRAFSKNDKDITYKLLKIKHIRMELAGLPNNSIVFGELHSLGIRASSIPTLLNNADEKLMFTVFAAPLVNDEDWSEEYLEAVMIKLKSFGLSVSAPFLIPRHFLDDAGKESLLKIAIEHKWEGWVLKEGHIKGWYKLKPVKTIDAFVTDTCRSTSDSFTGGLKRVHIGIWNEDGTIHDLGNAGNGFKKPFRMQFMSQEQIDAAREKYLKGKKVAKVSIMEMFKLPRLEMDTLLNKVCEIAYDSITAGKKLRFPRFVRWRDDKDIKDCTTEQLEN